MLANIPTNGNIAMNEGSNTRRAWTRAEAVNVSIALAALSTGTESISSLLRFLHDEDASEPEGQTGRLNEHLGQLGTALKDLQDANSRLQFLGMETVLALSPNGRIEPFSISLPPPSAK
jgi:hypothetical protein